MRHDDQPVDLLVAVVGERKNRPIAVAFTSAHFNSANNSIRTRRSRDLDAIAFSFLDFGGGGQIDSGRIETHVDGIHRVGGGNCKERNSKCCRQRCQATRHGRAKSPFQGGLFCSAAAASLTVEICKQSHPVKAFKADITPISRLLKKRTFRQSVSTILPMCALVSMSAWAAGASFKGKVL